MARHNRAVRTIVVGVDGSEGGQRALRWAITEAARVGGAVRAVTAWQWDGQRWALFTASTAVEERRYAEEISASETEVALAACGDTDVPVSRQVRRGAAAAVLTAAASRADLLVVGTRAGSHCLVADAVRDACVRAATCPVVVVPQPPGDPAHS